MSGIGWEWIAENDAELRSRVVRMFPNSPHVEDALHDAYLSVAERIDPHQNPSSFILWKVKNLLTDEWRQHGRRAEELEDMARADNVADMAIAAVMLEQTCCAIQRLPADEQLVMWARMAGHSQTQIATLLGIPLGTVKTRQRSALKGLAA